MKTLAQVKKENAEYKTLINAVIKNIGIESVQDVINHGIDGGFSGFIYYGETHAFAMKHRETIINMLEAHAQDSDQDIIEMVSGFGVFRNAPMDNGDKKELYKYIGLGKCEQSTITNLMAWFAAEEVCRMFEN